jgi:hypothetical protein
MGGMLRSHAKLAMLELILTPFHQIVFPVIKRKILIWAD